MKITVKNFTYNPVSVDTFKLDPQESRTFDIPDQVAERVIEQLDLASTTVSYRILGEISDDSITSPVTLYVETTGSDINPGTLAKPFKTIQAAIDSLVGKTVRNRVLVQAGAGIFDGFTVDQPSMPIFSGHTTSLGTDGYGLIIQGTWKTATLATGTTSGTLGGASVAITNLVPILTDGGQNWTVNDLRGKFINFASAPTAYYPIISNTATTLEYAHNVAINNTTYQIVEPATTVGAAGTTAQNLYGNSSNASAAVILNAHPATQATNNILVRYFKISAPTISSRVVVINNGAQVSDCLIDKTTATSGGAIQMMGARPAVSRCYILLPANTQGILIQGVTGATIQSSALRATASGCDGLWTSSTRGYINSLTMPSVTFDGAFSEAMRINGPVTIGSGWSNSVRFIGCTTAITIGVAGASIIESATNIAIGVFFSGCTTCVTMAGPLATLQINHSSSPSPTTNTGNTTGIVVARGAKCRIDSAISTLGCSGTELSVDGATSTLAGMRASSPKIFPTTPNAYGSYIYE